MIIYATDQVVASRPMMWMRMRMRMRLLRPQTVVMLLEIRRRRLRKLLRHVKDESMIHLSYTNRTLSLQRTRYILHATHDVNDHLRDRSSSSLTKDVDVDADADEVFEAAYGGSAAGDKKKTST